MSDRRAFLSGIIGLMVASRTAVDLGLDWRALWLERHRRAFDTARGVLTDEQIATFRHLILGIELKANAGDLAHAVGAAAEAGRAVAARPRLEARIRKNIAPGEPPMPDPTRPHELDHHYIQSIALDIVPLLDGLTVGEARAVLDMAASLIETAATVDASDSYFSEGRRALEARATDSGE